MKVILLQDVSKIGRRFEIVDVPSGHALNKLIPQGLAEEATPQNVKKVEARAARTEAERVAADAAFAEALEALADKEITIEVDANENGHLFEALKSERIAEVLAEEGVQITAQQIHIKTPIKELGEHTVELREGDKVGEATINVVAR